jgi:ParB-like chromosome segregation protein Spo0J
MAETGNKQKSPPRRQPVLDHIENSLWPLVEPIGSITADPANARRHSDRNLEVIRASLRAFGQQKPIVVDADGICRAGSGTLEAAKAEGWTHIAVARTSLAGAEATAYAIADNRSGDPDVGSTWDVGALHAQLDAVDRTAFNLGFEDLDLQRLRDSLDVPEDNQGIDEGALGETSHKCPSCGFEW